MNWRTPGRSRRKWRNVGKTLAFGDRKCQKGSVLCERAGGHTGKTRQKELGFSLHGRRTERGVHDPAVMSSLDTPSPPASALEGASLASSTPAPRAPRQEPATLHPKPAFLGFILFQREAIPGPRRALTWAPRVCIHSWGERRPHRRGLRDGHGDQGLRSLSAACRGADTCYVSEFSGLGPRHPAAAPPSPRPSS